MNLFRKQKQTHRHGKQTMVPKGKREGGGKTQECGLNRSTLSCVAKIKTRAYCRAQGTPETNTTL